MVEKKSRAARPANTKKPAAKAKGNATATRKAKPTARAPKAAATKRPAMTPAEYAWASLDTMLANRTHPRDDGEGRRVYAERGRDVALLSRAGDELVLDFEPPSDRSDFASVERFYAPSPARPGWLRYRRPATRDPRPALEANLGAMLGAACAQRNPLPAFRSIVSAGGPYVCMELSRVPSWGGACDADEFPEEAALYEKALAGDDAGSVLLVRDGSFVLVLGTPDPLYAALVPGGGMFARAVSNDADDAALEAMLAAAPADGWTRIGGPLDVREPLRAFDAAEFGGAIGAGNALTLALPAGSYDVAARTWMPDAATELLLVKLTQT